MEDFIFPTPRRNSSDVTARANIPWLMLLSELIHPPKKRLIRRSQKKWTAAKIGLKDRKTKIAAAKYQSDLEVEHPEDSFSKRARFRSRKPGKKEMVKRKRATIFARKKGTDLWYCYKFLGKGTKNTKEGLKNPWLNVQTEDGKEIGFRENDIDWLYGTNDSIPVSIKTFVTYDNQIPVDAKMLTDDKIGEAYVTFITQKYWNYPFVKEAKERELANFDKFMVYKVVKDNKTQTWRKI